MIWGKKPKLQCTYLASDSNTELVVKSKSFKSDLIKFDYLHLIVSKYFAYLQSMLPVIPTGKEPVGEEGSHLLTLFAKTS